MSYLNQSIYEESELHVEDELNVQIGKLLMHKYLGASISLRRRLRLKPMMNRELPVGLVSPD